MRLIVAIDGPAAAGKGTLARRIAAEFRLPYLDTGKLYRAVGRKLLEAGADPADAARAIATAAALEPKDLDRSDLRAPDADKAASEVAAIPGVRAALLAFQRRFAADGAVLDGRDIGTVICPDAPVKLFITASLEARALRRYRERQLRRENTTLEAVEAEMRRRDALDATRAAAPLRPAPDATVIDTTDLDETAVFARAADRIRAALGA